MRIRLLNNLLRVTLSLVMSLAIVHQAHAGAGWGDSTFSTGAPKKVPTYYANSPSGLRADPFGIGPAIDTGNPLRKFIDPLPVLCGPPGTAIPAITGGNGTPLAGKCIPVANPDIASFPGSDYYEIGVVEFSEYLHGDLPKPTRLRAYVQLNDPANPVTVVNGVVTQGSPRYLGPIIVATKDRPVRIKYKNLIPTGPSGDLFIPVDKTLMSAGMGPVDAQGNPCDPGAANANCAVYTENRATIHLHGGNTPWISDGTPHQWIVPAGEPTPLLKGASFQVVPDMQDPGAGAGTLYYTNNQSSRLMFYHDHVAGITRLNVYVGEVAGYLVADKANTGENLLPLPTDQIPLILQDKTFVPKDIIQPLPNGYDYSPANSLLPNPAGINQASTITGLGQDEKWDVAHWGQYGDLWFPNVYEFNQDPDSFDATNPVGRWDWGPYFWPVFPADLPLPDGSYGSASTTPEAFNDTPVINGAAYPTLTVDPKAYRFRILNGANDRFFNLGFYLAGKVVQSCAVTNGGSGYNPATTVLTFTGGHDSSIPNPMNPTGSITVDGSGAITAITLSTFGTGYTTAPTLSFSGAGSGATATCTLSGDTEMVMVPFDSSASFPNTGGLMGTGWGTPDARDGGVPSPVTAGPDIIQIGTEGGMLPAPVVIPSTPINYEYNKRSVTVLNILEKGLFLGAAERADVVVDFCGYAGKTLILYNDSPAPVPAGDPRIDYYTGNPDLSSSGGAGTTQPGIGPNTRTIMQVKVNSGGCTPYSVSSLAAAFPAAYAGTQDKPLVPESAYNGTFNQAWTNTYAKIFTGAIYRGGYQGLTFVTPEDITYTKAPVCDTPAACLAALPASRNQTAVAGSTVTAYLESKAIQELFDPRGRMNATQGTELLFTTANTQTTIPLGYIDPATEIIADGETQFWKITHNGVDTHPVHFHLVNVQLINRVGWDGTVKPPDANEVGWKETVRMNPLEDVIVAIRAKAPPLPFGVPNSSRSLDPSQALGATMGFNQIDPFTGVPAVVGNVTANFGWEYVWHCHILGHEENDFMRPFIFRYTAVVPDAPTNPGTTTPSFANTQNNITITWTDPTPVNFATLANFGNPKNEIGFSIERCAGLNCSNFAPVGTALANATSYTETALDSDRYSYVVKAYNAAGESAASTIISVHSDAVIDGICGTSNGQFFSAVPTTGLCSSGQASVVVNNGGVLGWSCTGINSGTTATCAASIPTYSVSYTAGAGGTLSGTTPQTITYNLNATAVTAVPAVGYHFVNWTEGATVISTLPQLTVTNVVAPHSYTANFAINTYTLSYTAGTGGTITGTTPQTVNYFANATMVSAVPDAGYQFINWTDSLGTVVSTSPDLTIAQVIAANSYTANFGFGVALGNCITGPASVSVGSLPTYTFTAPGFNIAATVNGTPVTLTNNSYTFTTPVLVAPVVAATYTLSPVGSTIIQLVNGVTTTAQTSLANAYAAAATGNTIQMQAGTLTGSFTAGSNKTVTLAGGYNAVYSANCGTTMVQGTLTVGSGKVIVNNLVIK